MIFVRLLNYNYLYFTNKSTGTTFNPNQSLSPPFTSNAAPGVGQSLKGHVTCTCTDRSSSLGGLHIRKGGNSNILFSSIDRFVFTVFVKT
jgi:hypothetical protein